MNEFDKGYLKFLMVVLALVLIISIALAAATNVSRHTWEVECESGYSGILFGSGSMMSFEDEEGRKVHLSSDVCSYIRLD